MTEIFAHRGLHTIEPENTVAAFLEARAAGVDGVELDVRRTSDGALVIHHDAEVAGVGLISAVQCQKLPHGLATLAEAMTACSGLRVNVEIKNDPREAGFDPSGALAAQIVTELGEMDWLDSVIISSFDLATCQAVRRSDPQVLVGWLLDWRHEAELAISVAMDSGLNAVHPFFQRVSQQLVADAHRGGMAVNVWTVNAVEDMGQMFDWDVDSLITDLPAEAIAVRTAHLLRS